VSVTTTATMRAAVQSSYGTPDVLSVAQVAQPTIADHEVLVRVHAAGLDRGTWHLMTGKPYALRLVFGLRRPKNPVAGIDLFGTVVSVGATVTRFSPGDEVYGIGRGSFAEYAAAREDKLASKPATLTFEQAAVVPVSALTALQASDIGRIQPDQRVLITGASGGVGTYAVQIAAALGAEVTGVASTSKLDLVRSHGADHVLDYTRDDFADGEHRYDVVIDIGGSPSLARLRRALTHTGTAVIVGGEGGGSLTGVGRQLRAVALSPFVRQRFAMFVATEKAAELERVTALIEAGHVMPSVDRPYPLDRVAEAMRRLDAGDARGKIVITI